MSSDCLFLCVVQEKKNKSIFLSCKRKKLFKKRKEKKKKNEKKKKTKIKKKKLK